MIHIRFNRERGRWVLFVKASGSMHTALHDSWVDAMRYGKAYLRLAEEKQRWWVNDPVPQLRVEPAEAFG